MAELRPSAPSVEPWIPPQEPEQELPPWYTRGGLGARVRPYAQQVQEALRYYNPVPHAAGPVSGAAEFLTPTYGGEERGQAVEDFSQGNYGRAALGTVLGTGALALDLIPGGTAAKKAAGALPSVYSAEGRALAAQREAIAGAPPALTDHRVAQRVPTAVNTPYDPALHDLRVNMDAARVTPEFIEKMAANLGEIIPEKVMKSADPEEKLGAAQAHITANLDALYRRQDPTIRERSGHWYPGGNKLLQELSDMYGRPIQSVAGGAAALSPQKDWFQNFDLNRRLIESLDQDPVLSAKMLEQFRKLTPLNKEGKGLGLYADDVRDLVGTPLSKMSDRDAAKVAVIHDITSRPRAYQALAPEGYQLGHVLTGKGAPASVAWGSAAQTANAIQALRSGGDYSMISGALGDRHKVRNFYNNLVAPSGRFDDYTSDTHNVAASLMRPLAGSDPIVEIGLGGKGGRSAATGVSGLYPVFADAGREAARMHGVAPFQMQSPTWEGVRSIFPDTFKTATNKRTIDDVWSRYRSGELTQQQAQEAVFKLAPQDPNQVPWRQY